MYNGHSGTPFFWRVARLLQGWRCGWFWLWLAWCAGSAESSRVAKTFAFAFQMYDTILVQLWVADFFTYRPRPRKIPNPHVRSSFSSVPGETFWPDWTCKRVTVLSRSTRVPFLHVGKAEPQGFILVEKSRLRGSSSDQHLCSLGHHQDEGRGKATVSVPRLRAVFALFSYS